MPLPLIPLVTGVASLAVGALGLKKGVDAKKIFDEASKIGGAAQRRYKNRVKELENKRNLVNQELQALGEFKKKVFTDTLGYIVQQVRNARSTVEGFDEQITSIDIQEVDIFDKELTVISKLDISAGGVQGLAAGTAGAFGAYGAVGLLATASTGTAISSLSGAAATNATLAWLGGGSLASGGLGVAGGTWVLGGLVAGPALAIAGYTLASKAEEALTRAEEYKAEVDTAIAELDSTTVLLDAIQSNIDDTRYVLGELMRHYLIARNDYDEILKHDNGWRKWLSKLRGKEYQHGMNQLRGRRLANLVAFGKSIKAVVSEPLLDSTGAATQRFNARIAGVVSVECIDGSTKPCINCGFQINPATRICPECSEPQNALSKKEQAEAESNAVSGTSPNTKKGALLVAIIVSAAALAGAFTYWGNDNQAEALQVSQNITMDDKAIVPPEQVASITDPNTPIQENVNLIDAIVRTEVLGMPLQYFETLTGPAKHYGNSNREKIYEIDGCRILAILSSDEPKYVVGLNVAMDYSCQAKISGFIPYDSSDVMLSSLTLRQITDYLQSHPYFSADCLIGCGDSYVHNAYASWIAAPSLDFLEVSASVPLVGVEVLGATEKWAEYMAHAEGQDWLISRQFNCNKSKYQEIAVQLFSDFKPSSITFGKSLETPACPS